MIRRWAALPLSFILILSPPSVMAQSEPPALLEPVGVRMDTQQVIRGDIYKLSVYDGEVIPYVEGLTFEMDGYIDSVDVMPGQRVAKGDILARLDESSEREQRDDLARRIARDESLLETDAAIAAIDLRAARLELERAEREYAASRDEASYRSLIEKRGAADTLALTARQAEESARLRLNAAKRRLADLDARLGHNVITAPFDGTVVYIAYKMKGARMLRSEYMVFLADDTRLSLQSAYISLSELRSANDLYARIGDADYRVTPDEVDMSEFIARSLAGVPMRITYTFDNPPADVKSGDYAAVFVQTGLREDVLYIPSNALYSDASGRYVYRVDGDERTRVAVTTGTTNGVSTVILTGLSEGDAVYVKE